MKTKDGDFYDWQPCCATPPGTKHAGHGAAIYDCSVAEYVPAHAKKEQVGEMWVDNGEYATQVNFCPFCGTEALVKIQKKEQ